jgi:hypothetical protein
MNDEWWPKMVFYVAFRVINRSILRRLFTDMENTETRHIFTVFMKSLGKRFANISENKTNANKTSSEVVKTTLSYNEM